MVTTTSRVNLWRPRPAAPAAPRPHAQAVPSATVEAAASLAPAWGRLEARHVPAGGQRPALPEPPRVV